MRRVQIGDILALAGAIAGRPDGLSHALRLCREAHAAHAYMKRWQHLHPVWGNGSLMARALAQRGVMQSDWSPDGVAALATACRALSIWRLERLDCRKTQLCATIRK